MQQLKQNQVVTYRGQKAIILGFMNCGDICIECNSAVLYVKRGELC